MNDKSSTEIVLPYIKTIIRAMDSCESEWSGSIAVMREAMVRVGRFGSHIDYVFNEAKIALEELTQGITDLMITRFTLGAKNMLCSLNKVSKIS